MPTIPRMKSDDVRKFIREGILNKIVDKVNEQFEPVVDLNNGFLCVVDTRKLVFTTTNAGPSSEDDTIMTNWASFDIELDVDEFPVRAVVRHFDTAAKRGTYERCASTEYNRTTKQLLVDTGARQSGDVYVELWKQIRS